MPDLSTISFFLLACLALNATPGPDMLLIATRSAAQGRLAGLATYLGIATGAYVHAAALALGLSQLFIAVPMAYDIVRFMGAGYLLFLAYQAFRHTPNADPQSKPAKRHSTWAMYRQGMLTNVLNPKVALFFLALFPQFLDIERGAVGLQILILATILNLSGLIVNGVVIFIAASARTALSHNQRIRQRAQYFTGIVFTALAARLVFDTKG
ncbi:amino acid transporter [Amylibacter ulvae]|uniref:Amino acid transporter n=1 Tax=Paramylibacter ulvae TaxID=1651968 RepID=A0ABQ3D0Y3_9RHOB|nr:LysE family translocator [Amylibacter ulvae]GHA53028.1 amino acid transporter [Amylibacter ulvae]